MDPLIPKFKNTAATFNNHYVKKYSFCQQDLSTEDDSLLDGPELVWLKTQNAPHYGALNRPKSEITV